jgi:hypothetical protein
VLIGYLECHIVPIFVGGVSYLLLLLINIDFVNIYCHIAHIYLPDSLMKY